MCSLIDKVSVVFKQRKRACPLFEEESGLKIKFILYMLKALESYIHFIDFELIWFQESIFLENEFIVFLAHSVFFPDKFF